MCNVHRLFHSTLLIVAMAVGTSLVPSISRAATINVTANALDSLTVSGQCSLRKAITNINNGADTFAECTASVSGYGANDTINIPAGTYTTTIAGAYENNNLTGDYDILNSVSIVGAGAAATIINGNGAVIHDRVFDIAPPSGKKAGVVLSFSGVTITGGNSAITQFGYPEEGGGGIRKNNGTNGYQTSTLPNTLSITNCIISGNTTDGWGGGIYTNGYTYGQTPDVTSITNSTITGNTAASGGGIYTIFGYLNVASSTITGNTATGSGGGVYVFSLSTITDSTVSNNTAGNTGGGIEIYGKVGYTSGKLTITRSTIANNSVTKATGFGGGINNGATTLTITDSTVSGNAGASSGGGIDSDYNSTLIITNSTFSGNSAGYGGAITTGGTARITNSTISGNAGLGINGSIGVGGINNSGGTSSLQLSNTIVASQTKGDDCSFGGVGSVGNNLESGTTCNFRGASDQQNTNPMLAALASNGGPTQTMALQPGSPAIDAGPCVQAKDQRGIARPQGAGCDIGAFEATAGISKTYDLIIGKSGTGAGTVASNPVGISCGSDCSESYATGTSITLTAAPASGSAFSGWGGACSGTSLTCALTMAAAKSVTASFSIALLGQTIAFGTAPSTSVGGTGTVSATASSGLPVTISSLSSGICSMTDRTVTGIAAGNCTLAANQAGNASFSPAPQATLSFSITANPPSPPSSPTISSITLGRGRAAINFSPPVNTGGSPISSYTATCTASGRTTRTASGSASPISVKNLDGGVIYRCTLTATNSQGSTSAASAPQPVIPMKSSTTPILMLLLD